jgi:site-specific DNA-cytosine methylase
VTKQNIDDYLVDEFGIFDLTERECLRLMGVNDELIDKMAAVNSRTQLYKQAGNSIVVTVLMAIFSQLNIKGVTPWNELTQDQREEMVQTTR